MRLLGFFFFFINPGLEKKYYISYGAHGTILLEYRYIYKYILYIYSMKVNKMITLDDDLIPKIKEINASATINRLLRDYLDVNEDLSLEELRAKTKKLMSEKAIISKKILNFRQKTAKIQHKIDEKRQETMDSDAKETRKKEVEDMKQKYLSGEITEDEYIAFFD